MNQGLLNYQKLMQQMNVSPEGQEMAAQGGDMINTLNHQQTAQMPPQPSLMQRMGQGVKDFTNDPVNMANLAASMNSMVINPNEFYNQNARDVKAEQMARMKQQAAQEEANTQRNATAEYLFKNGAPQLAEQVIGGFMTGSEAIKMLNAPEGEDKSFDHETKLRGEFRGLSQTFISQNKSFGRVQASVANPSPAGDLSLIFNYMKMLDPGSVVRESEFAQAAATGSLGQRFVAVGTKLREGKRLTPEQRADFYDSAKKLFDEANRQHETLKGQYMTLADQTGLNHENIVTDFLTANLDFKQPGPPQSVPGTTAGQDGSGVDLSGALTTPGGIPYTISE